MKPIPSDPGIDHTISLVREGYRFISNRCDRYQSDIFQTRLLFQKTICFRGEAAAQVFYDNQKFKRHNATPKRIQKTLVGEGGVQGLDGESHCQRKQIFMALMTPENLDRLSELTQHEWIEAAKRWQTQDHIVLLDEAHEVLCRAVCAWSGVPLPEAEVKQRTQDLAAMIDGAGGVALRYLSARWGRQRTEQWIGEILEKIRANELEVSPDSAAYAFAWHRDRNGNLLERHAATVDLINVLRPVVAIARYITFAALALYEHPHCAQALSEQSDYANLFTQEVRRFYPFFPAVMAKTCQSFDWNGYYIPEGVNVMLDLYGTNHDPNLWNNPEKFDPERFRQWNDSNFNLIPQGGGDYYANHRCAGEWITIRLMEMTLNFLVNSIRYDVPDQDLSMTLSRIPTMPKSGFIMRDISLNVA